MAIKYLPIWEQLKTQRKVVLAVPVPLHDKLIKEVIRIKDEDLIFKLEASLARKKYKISYTVAGARITIILNEYCDLKELAADEF